MKNFIKRFIVKHFYSFDIARTKRGHFVIRVKPWKAKDYYVITPDRYLTHKAAQENIDYLRQNGASLYDQMQDVNG